MSMLGNKPLQNLQDWHKGIWYFAHGSSPWKSLAGNACLCGLSSCGSSTVAWSHLKACSLSQRVVHVDCPRGPLLGPWLSPGRCVSSQPVTELQGARVGETASGELRGLLPPASKVWQCLLLHPFHWKELTEPPAHTLGDGN